MVHLAAFAFLVLGALEIETMPGLARESPPIAWACDELGNAGRGLPADVKVRLVLRCNLASLPDIQAQAPDAADGFALVPSEKDNALYVVGADARGVIYGALWLADRLRIDGVAALGRCEKRAPVFAHRNLNDGVGYRTPKNSPIESDLQLSLRFGCNVELARVSPYSCADWAAVDARLAPYQARLGGSTEASRQAMRDFLAKLRPWNLETVAPTSPFYDMVDFDTLIELFGDEVSEDGSTLSPALEKPWELWQGMVRQFFDAFPETAGIRVTMQDAPERVEMCLAKGPKAEALGPAGIMRRFVEKARQVVVEEHKRRVVITSWGNPPDTYPLNVPKDLRRIFSGIPADGLVLQNNNCEHDFYLISPFNDNFGMALVPQGIMVQVQRQEQGRGYVPVYTGPQLRREFSRCARLGDTATAEARLWAAENMYEPLCWTWWNLYAWHRACWEPDGDPWDWARDWNVLRFGHGGAETLADALMMTEDIALRTFYLTEVSGSKRDAYAIARRTFWTDGRHYSEKDADALGTTYRENHLRGHALRLIEQAEDTRAMSRAALAKATEAARAFEHPADAALVVDSFKHLDALVTIGTHYQQAILSWHYEKEPDLAPPTVERLRRSCARHARAALNAFNAYWSTYSLYKDGGMVATLRGYLRELGQRLPEEPEPSKHIYLPWSDATFSVDGTLNESWPEPSVRLGEDSKPEAPKAEVRVARGADALHAAITVHDDTLVPVRVGRLARSDSVELSFDTNADGKTDTTCYLALDDATRQPVLLWVLKDMVLGSRNYQDRATLPANAPGAAVAMRREGSVTTWECAIPWAMLRGFDPKGATPLGVFITVNDVDAPQGVNNPVSYPPVPVWREPPPPPFAYGVGTMAEAERANKARGPERAGFKKRMFLPS